MPFYDNPGARGATSRDGMAVDNHGYVKRSAPLPGQITPGDMTPARPGAEYPKTLYAKGYAEAQKVYRETVLDGSGGMQSALAAKQIQDKAFQLMRQLARTVLSPEEEEEAILDGYRANPADHLVEAGEPDPRVPVGAEARRSRTQQRQSLEQDVQALRLELARKLSQLQGKALEESLDEVIGQTATEPVAEIDIEVPVARPKGRGRKAVSIES